MSDKHSDHWRNPETGQVECDCCCGWALDYDALRKELVAERIKREAAERDLEAMRKDRNLWQDEHNGDCPNAAMVETLKAQVERLTAALEGSNVPDTKPMDWRKLLYSPSRPFTAIADKAAKPKP